MKEKVGKKGITRRLFSVVLALAMVISLLPMNSIKVYADAIVELGSNEGLTAYGFSSDWDEQPSGGYACLNCLDALADHDYAEWWAGEHTLTCGATYYVCLPGNIAASYHADAELSDGDVCAYCGTTIGHPSWPTASDHIDDCNHQSANHFYFTGVSYNTAVPPEENISVEGRAWMNGLQNSSFDCYYDGPASFGIMSDYGFTSVPAAAGWFYMDENNIFKPCTGSQGGSGGGTCGLCVTCGQDEDSNNHDPEYPSYHSLIACVLTSGHDGSHSATPVHAHNFTYSASGATLTATCSADGCGLTDKKVSLTLTASSANYSGSPVSKATLFSGMNFTEFNTATKLNLTVADIKIYASDDTSKATPLDEINAAGSYVADLTVDTDKTATLNFNVVEPPTFPEFGEHTGCQHSSASAHLYATGVTYEVDGSVYVEGRYWGASNIDYYEGSGNNLSILFISTEGGGIGRGWYYQDGMSLKPCVLEHTHTDHYGVTTTTTANDTLTWYCGAGCPSGAVDAAHAVKLTLTASSANYSGSAVKASFVEADKTAWTAAGLTLPTITYEAKTGSSLTSDEAVNVGSYTAKASITVMVSGVDTTYTATKDFEITKGEQSGVTVTMDGYTYNNTPSTPSTSGTIQESATPTYYYNTANSNEGGTKWENMTGTSLEPDTYYMYAVLAETDNYAAFTTQTTSFTVTGLSFTGTATANPNTVEYDGDGHGILLNTSGDATTTQGATITYCATETGTYSDTYITYTDVGNYTIYYKVTKTGYTPLTGSGTVTITAKALTADNITIPALNATGSDIKDNIVIKFGSTTLVKGIDYEIINFYGQDDSPITEIKEAGDYKVEINFKGNYSGTGIKKEFTVSKKSSGGYTPTPPTQDIPVIGDTNTKVEVEVSGNTAQIEKIDNTTIENIVSDNTSKTDITLDMSSLSSTVTTAVIPTDTVEAIAEVLNDSTNNKTSLEIKLPNATVQIDAKALESIASQAKGNDIQLVVDNKSQGALNASQQGQLNGKVVEKTFEAYFVSGGTRISNFNGGLITVGKIDFKVPNGKNPKNYHVEYLPANGNAVRHNTWFKDGILYFDTTHFSDYAIVYDETQENGEPVNTTIVARLFNPRNGDHFYTTGAEVASASAAGWGIEANSYFSVNGTGSKIYRAYCPASGDHFYTANKSEWENARKCGYVTEGVAFTSSKTGKPVYRLYNPKNGDHFYTTSAAERDNAIKVCGYNDEGIAFYVD